MLDLKGKVVVTEEVSEGLLDIATEHEDLAVQEALLALEALGYSKRELKKVEKRCSNKYLVMSMKLLSMA